MDDARLAVDARAFDDIVVKGVAFFLLNDGRRTVITLAPSLADS